MNKNIKKLAQAKADKFGGEDSPDQRERMRNRQAKRVTSKIPSVYGDSPVMPKRPGGYRTSPTQIGRENALSGAARVTKVDGKMGLYPNRRGS